MNDILEDLLVQVRMKEDPYDVVFTKEDIDLLTNPIMLVSICVRFESTAEYSKDIYKMFTLTKETGDLAALLLFAAMRNKVVADSLMEVCPPWIREVLC